MNNHKLWNLAVRQSKSLLGYYDYEYINDWTEVLKRAKIQFGILCKKRKEEYKKYQKTEQWRKLKERILKKYGGLCEDCNTPAECIHHESYDRVYTNLEEYDCVPLCMICHMKRHNICESYNKNNIFIGECYMCNEKKPIMRVDSWSGVKTSDGSWIKGSWRNFCEDCVKEWGWEKNREYNKCCKCFEEFIGWKNQSKCKECCGDGF